MPFLLKTLLALCLAGIAAHAGAQTTPYPSKLIRLIVPFPPGAGVDIVTRSMAPKLAEMLGQQIVLDNKGGGGGILGADLAAKAAPDGYTLFMTTAGILTVIPHMNSKLPYSALKDFAPISMAASVPSMLAVHPSLPARSVEEFVALARAKPGAINYASTGNGTLPHLAAEFFKAQAKIEMVHVPYNGSAPALTDLLGGRVQVFFGNALSVMPHVQSEKLRALAVTSLQRLPAAPSVPALAQLGYPGFEAGTWFGLMAPAATPRDIINRLHADLVKVLRLPEVQDSLATQGGTTVGNTPEQFAAYIRSESDKWARVLKASGVHAD